MVFSRTICGAARDVGGRLRPDAVLGAAADREEPARHLAGLAIGLDDVVGAAGDALEQGAVDVAARVGEVQAEEHALGMRIVDRRPLAGEIGQDDQALGAGRRCRRLGRERRRRRSPDRGRGRVASRNQWVSVPLVASPAIDGVLAREEPGRIPEPRVARRARSISMMMKMVEPYMSIMSPAPSTPTLSASAAASMVPAMTGVPAASPVSRGRLGRHARRRCRSSTAAPAAARASMMSRRELGAPVLLVDDDRAARSWPPSSGR